MECGRGLLVWEGDTLKELKRGFEGVASNQGLENRFFGIKKVLSCQSLLDEKNKPFSFRRLVRRFRTEDFLG
jgi:hypothetical protein